MEQKFVNTRTFMASENKQNKGTKLLWWVHINTRVIHHCDFTSLVMNYEERRNGNGKGREFSSFAYLPLVSATCVKSSFVWRR